MYLRLNTMPYTPLSPVIDPGPVERTEFQKERADFRMAPARSRGSLEIPAVGERTNCSWHLGFQMVASQA